MRPAGRLETGIGIDAEVQSARDTTAELASQGLEPVGDTPEEFARYLREEALKWGTLVRSAGIKPE